MMWVFNDLRFNDGGRGGPGWAMVPPKIRKKKIEVKKIKIYKIWF
jgi:hypothetical protein